MSGRTKYKKDIAGLILVYCAQRLIDLTKEDATKIATLIEAYNEKDSWEKRVSDETFRLQIALQKK